MANFDEILNFGNGVIVDVTLNGTQNADGSYTAIAASGSDGLGDSIVGVALNVDGSDNKIWLNGPSGPNTVVDFGGLTVVTNGAPNGAMGAATADVNIYYSNGHYYEDTVPPTQLGIPTITCYCRGTLILTERGEVAVEALKRGDLVFTAAGEGKAINWIGRQTVSKQFADPLRAYPIRVRAGALAENTPSRDLLVSPDHALLVGGVLANAGALVNGTSITRETTIPELLRVLPCRTRRSLTDPGRRRAGGDLRRQCRSHAVRQLGRVLGALPRGQDGDGTALPSGQVASASSRVRARGARRARHRHRRGERRASRLTFVLMARAG